MTKKKLVSLCLVLALVLTAVVGGTMAYFTDKDAELNTFTVGKIDIDLVEDFEQGSELMPGLDVDKDAKIVNTGENPAWVWAEILIPAALDDADDNSPQAPGKGNSLHFNYPGANAFEYAQNTNPDGKWYNADLSGLWIFQQTAADKNVNLGYMGTETIDGVVYNKHLALYKDVLGVGEETSLFLDKVYMDKAVTQGAEGFILMDGKTPYNGTWEIIVRAYGIQETGFANVVDAWKAYDGETPVAK